MITGALKTKIDAVWTAFWSGGISNPLEVIEQITYLLFVRRLDDLQTLQENRARRFGEPVSNPIIPPNLGHLRWSRFKNLESTLMFKVVGEEVFPFLRTLGGTGTTYAAQMKGARFTIPTAALLTQVVDLLNDVPMQDRDTNGDLYEYMLGKLATSGQNGQFRTPRHIIQLMVEMAAPTPADTICDPACGTAGFLVSAAEYLRSHYPSILSNEEQRSHFETSMFHGYDFDATMLRIGSMNMLLHGVENPDIRYRDSLSEDASHVRDRFSLILANPPFKGSLNYETASKDLLRRVDTRKTEILFLALFLRTLKTGGRAAVIVPDGALFGQDKAHIAIRKSLVEEHLLQAVVKLPPGVFKPYSGVSTAILIFTKTNSGGTDHVWFYDVRSDGLSLDDNRSAVDSNDLPDVLERWRALGAEANRKRTDQSFMVPKEEIARNHYNLSISRYKEYSNEELDARDPMEVMADLKALELEIATQLDELEAALS